MKTRTFFSVGIAILLIVMSSCESKEFIDGSLKKQGTTEQSEFITLKSGAIVEKHGDKYIWQDDILLSDTQYKLLDETGDIIQDPANEEVLDASNVVRVNLTTGYDYIPYDVKTRSTAIYPTPYNMWAMVRFTYAKEGTGTTLNANTRELIRQALHHWEANTNVRFYNATDQPTIDPTYGFAYPYVNFCDGTSNASYVGRIGGRQDLTLVPGGATVGTVIHEIGHATGLLHEQCRYDRDNYIIVNTNNIELNARSNFTKRTSNYYCIGAFDFGSIMLYSSYTGFEIDPSIPSMTRTDESIFWAQRTGLSDLDRRFPNTFYVPYIARSDTYYELAETVYKPDNTVMTPAERLQLQAELNNGNPTPPAGGRIPNEF